ncbi:hypothetical protein D3C72_1568200 [compost metagenome]
MLRRRQLLSLNLQNQQFNNRLLLSKALMNAPTRPHPSHRQNSGSSTTAHGKTTTRSIMSATTSAKSIKPSRHSLLSSSRNRPCNRVSRLSSRHLMSCLNNRHSTTYEVNYENKLPNQPAKSEKVATLFLSQPLLASH